MAAVPHFFICASRVWVYTVLLGEPAMSKADDTTIRIERTIAAPRDKVFAALTTAEIAKLWWTGPPWEFTNLTLDAKPGGKFLYAIRNSEDGSEYATQGEYQEAVLNERIVWTNEEGEGTLVTVELADSDGGTTLSVTQGSFPDTQTRDAHQGGWNGCLDQMEKLLTN